MSRYLGDSYAHPFFDHNSGKTVLASIDEIKNKLPSDNIKRIHNPQLVHDQVLELSQQGCYFLKSNLLPEFDGGEYFHFYCMRHQTSYDAQYQQFLNSAPNANGCPVCMTEYLARGEP